MVSYGTLGIRQLPSATYCDHVVIDHDSAIPLYVQVADLLRQQIKDGALAARLPSVKSLGQEHGVSHITAEKALAVLKDEGIIHSVIGKGYYVVERRT
jgi:DNA-binding GntR family transcriptional regulator